MADKYIYLNSGSLAERESTVTSSGVTNAGDIVALDSTGKLDASVMPSGIGADTKIAPASEDLTAGDFVNFWNDSGTIKVRKADASNGRRAHGFVLAGVSNGNNATVYKTGTNTQLTSLTPAAVYFLSGSTAGGVSVSAPSTTQYIVQVVGISTAATEIDFKPSEPITLA